MRWWLQTDTKLFSVDNASVKGVDFSTLSPDIWMVQWTDGRGEIERQADDGSNLNGLRETFIDVIPYCPFFQQFMRMLPGLLLAQAQKIQIELIREVYDSNRQAPFHYPVAAGDYWWDATDANMLSSVVPSLQNAIASINTMTAALNAAIAAINTTITAIQNKVNAVIDTGNNLVTEINASVVAGANSNIVYSHNALAGQLHGNLVNPGNDLIVYINDTLLGYMDLPANTVNAQLQAGRGGLTADIVHHLGDPFYDLTAGAYATNLNPLTTAFPSHLTVAGVPWTPLVSILPSDTSWIPFGGTTPVDVTPTEAAAILQGIAARSNDLNIKKNTKIGEVNALTTISDVIDYDVTAGW